MDYFKKIVALLMLLISFSTTYAFGPLSHEVRKQLAKLVLSMPDKLKLDCSKKLFKRESKKTCLWFKEHKKSLQDFLQEKVSNEIKVRIMGSLRWKTSHLLSDIDAVIIAQSTDSENIMNALKEYYGEHYKDIAQSSIKTVAGLYLFILKNFTDKSLGDMKLEYTIQTPEINKAITEGMKERIAKKFKNSSEKTAYALEMMEAVDNDDLKKQLELKEWTRVLAVKK